MPECIAKKKKFLFFSWYGDHEEEITYVSAFMRGDKMFVVQYECKCCGSQRERHFVPWSELIHAGIPSSDLIEISDNVFGKSYKIAVK